jgi:hypothetical protein
MLLYRVFPQSPGVPQDAPGSANHLHRPQGGGRWDNPALYDTWYLSTSAEGAIAETFGNLPQWGTGMFETPFLPGGRRALATFSIPDDLSIVNLDDAQTLLDRGMRPTQVVIRNSRYTQRQAARAFGEQDSSGTRRWAGISWWSFHRPIFTNLALWSTPAIPAPITLVEETTLSLTSPSVIECARILARPI